MRSDTKALLKILGWSFGGAPALAMNRFAMPRGIGSSGPTAMNNLMKETGAKVKRFSPLFAGPVAGVQWRVQAEHSLVQGVDRVARHPASPPGRAWTCGLGADVQSVRRHAGMTRRQPRRDECDGKGCDGRSSRTVA
jgi:hypothetical protein